MTTMQTPKQIVTERAAWANNLQVADRKRMQEAFGPALVDQMDAANQESASNLERVAAFIPGELNLDNQASDESLRAGASLIQYAYERATYICPHARQPRAPRPITALMAADVVACDQCRMPAVLKTGDQHPDACEFCGRATKTFFPNAFNFAHVTVMADVCESCAEELRELLNDGGRPANNTP